MPKTMLSEAELQEEAQHLQEMLALTGRTASKSVVTVVAAAYNNKAALIDLLGGWRKVVQVEIPVETETKWDPKVPVWFSPTALWAKHEGKAVGEYKLFDYMAGIRTDVYMASQYISDMDSFIEEMQQLYDYDCVHTQLVPPALIPKLREGQRLLPVALKLLEIKRKWLGERINSQAAFFGWNRTSLEAAYTTTTSMLSGNQRELERYAAALGAQKKRTVKAWVMISASPATPLMFGTKGFDKKACFAPTSVHESLKLQPGTIGVTEHMISVLAFCEDIEGMERAAELGQMDHALLGRGWGTMLQGVCAVHNIYSGQRDACVAVMRKAARLVAGVPEDVEGMDVLDYIVYSNRDYLYFNMTDGVTSVGDTRKSLFVAPEAQIAGLKIQVSNTFLENAVPERELTGECTHCECELLDDDARICGACNAAFCYTCWDELRRGIDYACCCFSHELDDYTCAGCQPTCCDCGSIVCLNALVSEDNYYSRRCYACHEEYEADMANMLVEDAAQDAVGEEEDAEEDVVLPSTTEAAPVPGHCDCVYCRRILIACDGGAA